MKWLRNIACIPIRLYQWTLSPLKTALMGPSVGCRFHPSCSNYALQAIQKHGIGKGAILAIKRILRCHPWGGEGPDPVPNLGDFKPRRNPERNDQGLNP